MAIIRSQVSGVLSMKGSSLSHPALFTRISSGPSSRSTVSTAAIALSRLVTSSRTARASPPPALISSAVFAATASWISAIATFAPSSARRVAIARPIPCAAPVTIATLPLRRLIPDAILCVTTSCPRSNRIRSWRSQPFSYRGPSAVDDKRRAGGERRVVTGEEQRHLRDLLGLADAVETRDSLHRGAGRLAAAHPPHHGRVDRARADCVDADVVAAVFERGDAGQRDHAGLGGAVSGRAFEADQSRDARGVDNRAAAVFDHVRQRVLHPQKDAAQVDRDYAVEVLFFHQCEKVAYSLDPGVVVEDVGRAEFFERRRDHRPGIGAL